MFSEKSERNPKKVDGIVEGEMRTTYCPFCDWSIHAPYGEDYLVEHLLIHAKSHHPEITITKEEIREKARGTLRTTNKQYVP